MFHMIIDQIQAYRFAIIDTTRARDVNRVKPTNEGVQNVRNCHEEEQIRLDGLMSVTRLAIQEAAAEQPHNPFSINDDVNQSDETPITPGPPPRREE